MADLLTAADKAGYMKVQQNQGRVEQEELVDRLREEVVGKFSQDLGKISGDIEAMRKQTLQEEEAVLKTLEHVRHVEEERSHQAKEAVSQY